MEIIEEKLSDMKRDASIPCAKDEEEKVHEELDEMTKEMKDKDRKILNLNMDINQQNLAINTLTRELN